MKKIVVVGASTGLGRCIGTGLAARGHQVTLMARRYEKLEGAVAEAGGNATAVACDATDPQSCTQAFDAAAEAMGGIDSVVYAAAVGPITRLTETTPEQWITTFSTNVIGANNVTQAALRHLEPGSANVLYLSTTGASYTPPWPGLAVYQTTKAALNHLVEAWRDEVPGVNFMRITIGECTGGEGDGQSHFNVGWDMELMGEMAPAWIQRGYMNLGFIDIEHLIDAFDFAVRSGTSMQMPSLTIIPRPPLG
jgi:NAD(P)-dependent dehydrogenase (short-subunit alcohol dehydrogenase family)